MQKATSYAKLNPPPKPDVAGVGKRDEAPWPSTELATPGHGTLATPARGEQSARIAQRLAASTASEAPVRCPPPETRRLRNTSPGFVPREASPERWTVLHPDWRRQWQMSLLYPATGKNRARVDDEDIPRLDEGEYLNDNLISFYIRYLQREEGEGEIDNETKEKETE